MIYEVSAGDLVLFTDQSDANIRPGTIGDTINFLDSVLSNIQLSVATDSLVWDEYATWEYGVRNESISDTLVFVDSTVPRSYSVLIDDFLILVDIVETPLAGLIFENITFSDNMIGYGSTLTTDTFTFTDEVTVQVLGIRTVTETLTFSDNMSSLAITALIRDIPTGYVAPTEATQVTLQDSIETLHIDNPDFNDSDTITYKRINRTSRGYTPIITGITGWLPHSAKKMTFSYLFEADVNKIKAFWNRNIGKPVTLTDMYGNSYTVILQNPEFEVAQVGRENRTLTMDFYVL